MIKKISGRTLVPPKTPVALGHGVVYGKLAIKFNFASLSKIIYVGNDGKGSVSAESGFPMEIGDQVVYDFIERLEDIYLFLDAEQGELPPAPYDEYYVHWIMLGRL